MCRRIPEIDGTNYATALIDWYQSRAGANKTGASTQRQLPADGVLPKREAEIQRVFQTVVATIGELKAIASEAAEVDKDFSIRATNAIDEMESRMLAGDYVRFHAALVGLLGLYIDPAFDISQDMRVNVFQTGTRSHEHLPIVTLKHAA